MNWRIVSICLAIICLCQVIKIIQLERRNSNLQYMINSIPVDYRTQEGR